MIIPTAVGRIDEITDAIREGDRDKAIRLINKETDRLIAKESAIQKEAENIDMAIYETANFGIDLYDNDIWQQARRDCGWKGIE